VPLAAELPIVPTISDLETKWGLRKEALRALDATEKNGQLSAAFDQVAAALGKRAVRPLLFIDDGLKKIVCKSASAELLGWRRGFNPKAGQDQWIVNELQRMDKDLEDIRTGKVEYYFEDSTPSEAEQGPYGGGDVTADAYVKGPYCSGGFYP